MNRYRTPFHAISRLSKAISNPRPFSHSRSKINMPGPITLPSPDDRSYEAAIAIWRSRLRPQRPASDTSGNGDLGARIPDGKVKLDVRGTPSIVGMKEWLEKLGHSTADVDRLNLIHVAGTKGKGSTCSFTESILRAFGQRTGFPRRTGLYSSPHLIFHEERFLIDGEPIDRDLMAKYFFELWDSLSKCENPPRFLQISALLALHIFIREGVEAAIVETHHGGEYDATNVLEHPVVTVVAPLGMDHAAQLGPTVRNIAWHKAGIFKPGAIAISASQEYEDTIPVLKQRAAEKQIPIHFISKDDSELPKDSLKLKPDVQRSNCSVALAAARAFLEAKAPNELGSLQASDIEKGVSLFSLQGRFQYVPRGDSHWYLDGAHNEMSVTKAAEWFIDVSKTLSPSSVPQRILVFNQTSGERDPSDVLERLAVSLQNVKIDHIIFPGYDFEPSQLSEQAVKEYTGDIKNQPAEVRLQRMVQMWGRYHSDSKVHITPGVEDAIKTVLDLGKAHGNVHTLVTGSLHLVGDALKYLQELDGRRPSAI